MGLNNTVNPNCNDYFSSLGRKETVVQKNICQKIKALGIPEMQVDPLQGQFLHFITKALQAKNILEIGTYFGYSSLWFAHALPNDGKLITCDINEEWGDIAKKHFEEDQVINKIEQIIQPALTTLEQWHEQGDMPSFDLIFIDADKSHYPNYVELCLPLLNKNGIIIIDNVWWGGAVINEGNNQRRTKTIRELNENLSKNPNLELTMIPIGDGMTMLRKL